MPSPLFFRTFRVRANRYLKRGQRHEPGLFIVASHCAPCVGHRHGQVLTSRNTKPKLEIGEHCGTRLRVVSPSGMPTWTPINANERGYFVCYRGSETPCPGCQSSNWLVGRRLAECARCGCALSIVPRRRSTGVATAVGAGFGVASVFAWLWWKNNARK